MRPRHRDVENLADLILDARNALFWERFARFHESRGPRFPIRHERTRNALAALPDDLAEAVIALDADELAAFGSGIEIAERLAAGQRFPKRERPASSGRGGVVRWGPTPAIPIDRARTTAP